MGRVEWAIEISLVQAGKNPVPIDVSDRIKSWTFEDSESKADKLEIEIDNWDLANFNTLVWKKGAIIRVTFGYVGDMAPGREMVVKKVTGAQTLKVVAYSKAFLMDSVRRTRTFDNVKRSRAVEIIADENGFGPSARFIDDTGDIVDHVCQANETDAQLLRRLATREGFEFFVDRDGLHWHARKVAETPQAELVWRADRTGTMLGFDITNDVTRQPARYIVRGRDKLKKKDFEFEVDAEEGIQTTMAEVADVASGSAAAAAAAAATAAAVGAAAGVAGVAFAGVVPIMLSREKTETAARKVATAKAARRRQATVKMTVDILGAPRIFAKSMIRVSGVGRLIEGNYYVKKHIHVGGDGGYTGKLTLIRDGRNRARGDDRLFERTFAAGGGGADDDAPCALAVTNVRLAIVDLTAARNTAVADATRASIPLAEVALERANAFLANIIDAGNKLAALDSLSRTQINVLIDAVHSNAASFRAVSASLSSFIFGKVNGPAANVQQAVESARAACPVVEQSTNNDKAPRSQDELLMRDLGGGEFEVDG